jgi:hypothetical protein
MTKFLAAALLVCTGALISSENILAQKEERERVPKTIIFALIDGGKRIEPVAFVKDQELVEIDDQPMEKFYKAKREYTLVFGGRSNGRVAVTKSNVGEDCGGNSAMVAARTDKGSGFGGSMLALATNAKTEKKPAGLRRGPNDAERAEVESLARAEFIKEEADESDTRTLRTIDVTAVDTDSDGVPEIVGTYWIPTAEGSERRTLFFIARRGTSGKYEFSHTDHTVVTEDDVMSGDLKDVDGGIGHELLLDVLDYDGDGVGEIFTLSRAFEGNNYKVYKRELGKWINIYEGYIYRCAY